MIGMGTPRSQSRIPRPINLSHNYLELERQGDV